MTKQLLIAVALCAQSVSAQSVPAQSHLLDDPFLEELSHRTFRWFHETTDPATGLTPDRWPNRTFSSVAAIGFGLTAYGIGAERGYITRDSAAAVVKRTLRFLYNLPQGPQSSGTAGYQGFFYHFISEHTGVRFDAHVELSTIDTALLLAGALFCQSYFDRDSRVEMEIRAYADSLFLRVNWKWFQVTDPPRLNMSWKPEKGFNSTLWEGYNEAMILYILALASPTHPIEPEAWKRWTDTYVILPYMGSRFISFGPLFGHQYSHFWIDFKGIRDSVNRALGYDYFENSVRATYSHQTYAVQNPKKYRDYSENVWGFTACDGPGHTRITIDGAERMFESYAARGVSADWVNDDGTIAPTAAGGSLMFTPEISIPALKFMKEKYGRRLYREYGFADAFNPTFVTPETPEGWFAPDHLGIDQGAILLSLENLRTGLIWKTMRKNRWVRAGLLRAGFSGGWLEESK